MRLLVTGGAGFIGSNFIRHILAARNDVEVLNLDALTYAGNLENLRGADSDPRYRFVHGDVRDSECVGGLMREVDAVVHFAAESHVDRSIESSSLFVQTNVLGTQNLLAAALANGHKRFIQISTDEVYGDLPWRDPEDMRDSEDAPPFTETSPLAPRSPYAASKAAADHLALAYAQTYGLDVIVTRSSNNYGPYQSPEKLIPLMVTNALAGRSLPVYGDGLNVRDWIHVRDHCRAIEEALFHGLPGEVYNVGGGNEQTNLKVVQAIVHALDVSEDLIAFVADRPGHDRRYALDATKAALELHWQPEIPFQEGLAEVIRWYEEHTTWWERVRSGEYQSFYEHMYGKQGRHAFRDAPPRPGA